MPPKIQLSLKFKPDKAKVSTPQSVSLAIKKAREDKAPKPVQLQPSSKPNSAYEVFLKSQSHDAKKGFSSIVTMWKTYLNSKSK